MGSVIRESLKSSIASYTGLILGIINVVFLFTRFLTPEELGLTRVLQDSTMLFVSFAQLGTPFIIIKFLPLFFDVDNKHNGFLFFVLIYSFIGFLLFSILLIGFQPLYLKFYADKSPLLIQYFFYLIPLVLGMLYINVLESYILIYHKVFFPTFVREVFLKFSNTFIIILFALKLITFTTLINLLVIAYLGGVLLLTFYIWKLDALFLKPDWKNFDFKKLRKFVGYGLFTLLGGIGFLLSTKIDTIMLPAYQGLKDTAIYSIAILIATVMDIPKRNLTQTVLPHLSFALKDNNLEKVNELYNKTSLNLLILGSLIFILVFANIDNIFTIIPKGNIYIAGKGVLILFLLGKLLDMVSGVNNEILLYSNYFNYALILIIILGIFTILMNIIFIPLLGIMGAAVAATLSGLIYITLKIVIVWRKFNSHPFNKSLFLALILLVIFSLLSLGLDMLSQKFLPIQGYSINSKIQAAILIIIKSSIICSIYFFSYYKLKVSADFNELIRALLKKIRGLITYK